MACVDNASSKMCEHSESQKELDNMYISVKLKLALYPNYKIVRVYETRKKWDWKRAILRCNKVETSLNI